mmetsp:Transcript_16726/g.27804  ORF Transcript_16726/g.27804 Transcript_16726/m.27804 type:complete len:101 (+) Transcript_16726:248-550(+)
MLGLFVISHTQPPQQSVEAPQPISPLYKRNGKLLLLGGGGATLKQPCAWDVGFNDGVRLGSCEGVRLGLSDEELGSLLGVKDGSLLGVKLGEGLGSEEGF